MHLANFQSFYFVNANSRYNCRYSIIMYSFANSFSTNFLNVFNFNTAYLTLSKYKFTFQCYNIYCQFLFIVKLNSISWLFTNKYIYNRKNLDSLDNRMFHLVKFSDTRNYILYFFVYLFIIDI